MLDADDRAIAAQEILDRLDQVEAGLKQMTPAEIARQIHSLKGIAKAFGFEGVAVLAHALEDEVDGFGRAAVVTVYLDRMHEAVELPEHVEPAQIEQLSASIRARLTAA